MIHPSMIFDPRSRGVSCSVLFGTLLVLGAVHHIVCHPVAENVAVGEASIVVDSGATNEIDCAMAKSEPGDIVESSEVQRPRGILGWRVGKQSPVEVAIPDYAQFEASGLASLVLQEGYATRARPGETSKVSVRMLGWTEDGEPISGYEVLTVTPVSFRVNQVVPGFGQGLMLMHPGERRRVWIPEELGYRGAPNRPGGTLIFDIELVSVAD